MLVHIFRCTTSGLHGATSDPSGEALPRDMSEGEWRHVRDVELEDGQQWMAIDPAQAIPEIRERGYHLLDGWYHRF